MRTQTYDICAYSPNMQSQILDVLSFLWDKDRKAREEYFKWKYIDNPHADHPLGIVALRKDRVVGFRGYFATRFEIADKAKDLIVLVAGDTCVHPDFQRRGLSVSMGDKAIEIFSGQYRLFLNMTTTPPSLPGYLKLGFQPLAKRAYVSHYTVPGLTRYLLTYKRHPSDEKRKTALGAFGPVIISEHSMPEAMARICAEQTTRNRRLRPLKDETFFRWRFLNPFNTYRFYYFRQNSEIKGYVVIGFSSNRRRAYILDYADSDGESVGNILRCMIQNKQFDILSVYRFSIRDETEKMLRDLDFKATGIMRRLEQKKTGELPVLIRPVRKIYGEADWKIDGLDVRNIRNWLLPEICSDSV